MSRPKKIEVGEEAARVPLSLPDPVFMLSLYNEDIRGGTKKLHNWQIDLQLRFAAQRQEQEIIRIALCSAWLAMSKPYSRSIITSASGAQLDRQTGMAITHIAEQVNRLHGP